MSNNPVEHLLPSRSIEIEVEGISAPMRTLVESTPVDGVFRVLAPFLDGRTFLFSGITAVEVIYSFRDSVDTKVFQIPCQILKKGIVDGLPVVTLQIAGAPKPTQRRRAFRVNVFSKIVCKTNYDEILELTTKDISVYGMFAYCNTKIPVGESIRVLWSFENDEALLEDDDFLARAFSLDEEEPDAFEQAVAELNKNKNSEEYQRAQKLSEEKKRYFLIDAHVISCNYDVETRTYAVRMNYDQIPENHAKRILRFLYKKQAEILSTDPRVAERIDDFFAREVGESPLPSVIPVLTMIALATGVLAVVLFMLAKPVDSTFMDSFLKVDRHGVWNTIEVGIALILSILAVGIETVSMSMRLGLAVKKTNRFKPLDALRPLGLLFLLIYLVTMIVINEIQLF